MSQTLDQLFADLCAKHDLTSISVEYCVESNNIGPDYGWRSYVHWSGATTCASANGGSASVAIARAVTDAQLKRVGVPGIIALELAA